MVSLFLLESEALLVSLASAAVTYCRPKLPGSRLQPTKLRDVQRVIDRERIIVVARHVVRVIPRGRHCAATF
jgi:hypothetical protein